LSCLLIACHFNFPFKPTFPKSFVCPHKPSLSPLHFLIHLPFNINTTPSPPLKQMNTTKMALQNYSRVSKQSRRTRRFRLGSKRFSVHRLRKKILTIFGFINRCMQFLCRCPKESNSKGCDVRSDSRRVLVPAGREEVRLRSYMRSNSFYAEAIKDCLDFIKRNSVPLDSYSETSSRCSDGK
jgi:hypothetical protein